MDTPPPQSSSTPSPTPSQLLAEQFGNVLNTLSSFKSQISMLSNQVKSLEKNVRKQIKKLEVFTDLKDFYHHAWGYRSLFYPKVFLYSGMANLELKNYRLAKSDFETFLRIWDSAPESLKEKQMARDAMEKINKAIS